MLSETTQQQITALLQCALYPVLLCQHQQYANKLKNSLKWLFPLEIV
jgi:hypothetical protein